MARMSCVGEGTDGGAEDRDEAHEGEGGHGGEEREAFRPLVWGMGRGQQADFADDDFLDQVRPTHTPIRKSPTSDLPLLYICLCGVVRWWTCVSCWACRVHCP